MTKAVSRQAWIPTLLLQAIGRLHLPLNSLTLKPFLRPLLALYKSVGLVAQQEMIVSRTFGHLVPPIVGLNRFVQGRLPPLLHQPVDLVKNREYYYHLIIMNLVHLPQVLLRFEIALPIAMVAAPPSPRLRHPQQVHFAALQQYRHQLALLVLPVILQIGCLLAILLQQDPLGSPHQ